MVIKESEPEAGTIRIILRPNQSLSQRQAYWLLLGCAVVLFGIAGGFAMLGLWPVLPFSGAEWLLLAYGFRHALRASGRVELITITDSVVMVDKARETPRQVFRFQRAWVSLEMTRSRSSSHPGRLAFRTHGKQVEIGGFLAEPEREVLAFELRQILFANGN